MGINFKSQKIAGHFPELWRGECAVLPGGFTPVNTIEIGKVVRRGTPLFVDFDKRTAAVCKTALVVSGGTTTAPRVAKGHYFAVGDTVAVNEGATAVTVKSIDSANTDYDVITFDKALTGVKADDILIESESEISEGKATSKYVPNMIVSADKEFKTTGLNTLDAGYDARVLKTSLKNTPWLDSWMIGGICLAMNPNILVITQ